MAASAGTELLVSETIALDIAPHFYLRFRNLIIKLRDTLLAWSGGHEKPLQPMRILSHFCPDPQLRDCRARPQGFRTN